MTRKTRLAVSGRLTKRQGQGEKPLGAGKKPGKRANFLKTMN